MKGNILRLHLNESREGFCQRGRGRSCHEDEKGGGTNSGEPGASSLEAERIRNRVASTGGRVKLKTVTQTRQSSAGDTFIAVLILY